MASDCSGLYGCRERVRAGISVALRARMVGEREDFARAFLFGLVEHRQVEASAALDEASGSYRSRDFAADGLGRRAGDFGCAGGCLRGRGEQMALFGEVLNGADECPLESARVVGRNPQGVAYLIGHEE